MEKVLTPSFSFLWDDCGLRNWYDRSQSALRPSYEGTAHCACPDVCFYDCMNGALLYRADSAVVWCVIKDLVLFIYSVPPGCKFHWLLGL